MQLVLRDVSECLNTGLDAETLTFAFLAYSLPFFLAASFSSSPGRWTDPLGGAFNGSGATDEV